MKLSYFEALIYHTQQSIPAAWPAPPAYFDPQIAESAFSEALEQGLFMQDYGCGHCIPLPASAWFHVVFRC
jgi:hypothetical protein